MLHINSSSPKHNDLHRSRITRDETDVKNIISLLQDTWLNLFSPDLQDLVCLSTGKVASSEVQDDLLQAKDVAEEDYKAFREQRLECDPPNVKFHDTMKKAKLKTFTGLNKKIKVKASSNQEVVLKAEKRFYAQVVVIAECRILHFHGHRLIQMASCARLIKPPWQRNSRRMYKLQMLFPNHQHA